jgi:hypothetical protein
LFPVIFKPAISFASFQSRLAKYVLPSIPNMPEGVHGTPETSWVVLLEIFWLQVVAASENPWIEWH